MARASNVVLLHCIVGPYVFILYMMFHLNAGDDNDDVKLTRRITDVGYDMCRRALHHIQPHFCLIPTKNA